MCASQQFLLFYFNEYYSNRFFFSFHPTGNEILIGFSSSSSRFFLFTFSSIFALLPPPPCYFIWHLHLFGWYGGVWKSFVHGTGPRASLSRFLILFRNVAEFRDSAMTMTACVKACMMWNVTITNLIRRVMCISSQCSLKKKHSTQQQKQHASLAHLRVSFMKETT